MLLKLPRVMCLQKAGAEAPAGSRKAAQAAANSLLAVLQCAMEPPAYATALVSLACSAGHAERVRRKALRLLVAAAESSGRQLAAADSQQRLPLLATANAMLAICTRMSTFSLPGGCGPIKNSLQLVSCCAACPARLDTPARLMLVPQLRRRRGRGPGAGDAAGGAGGLRGPGQAPGRSGARPVRCRGAHGAWRHTRSSQVSMPRSTAVRCVL